ncbi:interleukin 17a/f3 [Parambassis ranga]|uniref:Interleukin 17a/f3 n=1 Tax=Parambassis ranga TaxID=210632 RepID=A0A6P7HRX5_9TELE|nr:interleukin-17F-like [Parambassis ranga]
MLLVFRALLVLVLASLMDAQKTQTASVKLGTRPKGKTVRLVLDSSLLPHFASTSASANSNMSLSPWTYIESDVISRLPRKISQAQCLTKHCLSLQGEGEDAALDAKPITYQVLVLHRVMRQKAKKKAKNKYDFRLGTEMITVGCTCVRPSIIPQQ